MRAVLVVVAALAAGCQGFVGVQGGFLFPEDLDTPFGLSSSLEPGWSAGGRVGGYLRSDGIAEPGLALSFTYSETKDSPPYDGEYDILTFSPLLMGRLKVARSKDHPNGLLNPYIAAGPALNVLHLDGQDADLVDVEAPALGVDIRLGAAVVIHEDSRNSLAPFVEYRFHYFEPTITIPVAPGAELELESTVHAVMFGIEARF